MRFLLTSLMLIAFWINTAELSFTQGTEENTPVEQTQVKDNALIQEQTQTDAEIENKPKEQDEQQDVFPQEGASIEPEKAEKIITAIDIKGNKTISVNTIISKIKSRIGSFYQETVVNDDLKRLYLLGFFSDIKIDTEDYKGGIKLIVTVEERPLVEKITFSGMKHITHTDEKMKQLLKLKESQYLDYVLLEEDVQAIKKMYEKIGYTQAQISYAADINKETNKAKVDFIALEGSRVKIKEIFLEGNNSFSKRRLLKLIKTKHAWFFNPGVLKDETFKDDIERIKGFYRKNGFSDVELSFEITPIGGSPFLYITIKIHEGKKYLVGNITINGNENVAQEKILEQIKEALPDKVFSEEAVKKDISNIQGLYFDLGYISAQVEETISSDPMTNRVNITYNITEHDITYVNKIKIKGNVKTKDLVIRRELRLKPEDRFDGQKLRRSKERLENLGFFESISYDTEDTAVPNKKDLIVEVAETKTGAFSLGGGFSTVDQFVGFVEVEQKNFDWKNFPYFTGAGQDLKFRASFGTLTNAFDLSFTEPWLFDYPVSFGFDAYRRTRERDSDLGYGYDEDISGGDLRLGKELSEYTRGDIAYRFESIEISNITSTASDLLAEAGKNNISSMELGLTFDSRDNVFDTRKGDLLTSSTVIAGGALGGDKDFWKFFGRASHYFPLFLSSALEAKLRLGLADSYGNSNKVPIYERFFAGGLDTIRGYHERKIGPIDSSKDPLGGETLLVGNIEYHYPLVSFLKLAFFYDTGNVWSKIGEIGSGGFKSSAGFGLRIKTPVGPVVLDYGIPFNKEPGEDDKGSGRFHFSMRHGF